MTQSCEETADDQTLVMDNFIRRSAASMLIFLADECETGCGTLVHGLLLWDRFRSSEATNRPHDMLNSELASVACFIISVKFRDVYHPTLQQLARMTSFSCEDIARAEETVLSSLNWDIWIRTGD